MKELLEQIKTACAEFETNAIAQVEQGNKAAGSRARKQSLIIEKLMKQFRKKSVDYHKNLLSILSLLSKIVCIICSLFV